MNWTVGDIRITRLVEMEMAGGTRFILPDAASDEIKKIGWLAPEFADENGKLRMAIQSFLIEAGGKKIVVDTGLGNDKSGRRVPHWNGRSGPFLEDMAKAGLPPDEIDFVINTHLHVDHVGFNTSLAGSVWTPTFRNARTIMGRVEFGYYRDQATDEGARLVFEDSVAPVYAAGLVDLVDEGYEVCPGISLMSTPGHSIGHMSLTISGGGQTLMMGGDVFHHPCQIARPDWSSSFDFDPAQSARTRRALLAKLAGTPTLVTAGHFTGAGIGRIEKDGDTYQLVPAA